MRICAIIFVSLLLAGCRKDPVGETKADKSAVAPAVAPAAGVDITVQNLFPNTTAAGRGFNVQGDGRSAIAVGCQGPWAKGTIVFAGTELPTVRGEHCLFTAGVPKELYAKPGTYPVWIRYNGTDSNKKDFVVTP